MSLFRPDRRFVLLALGAVSGCGYTPAFAPGGAASELRISVAIDAPNDRNEFDLFKQLELRLGRPEVPRLRLSYEIEAVKDGVGVTPGQEIIRFNIFGKVSFSLTDIATGEVLSSGSTDTFTSFSVGSVDVTAIPPSTNATIATLAAERDANARLMVALADQIVTRLIATAPVWAR
ncbi:hypothetical protein HGD85_02710 [Rhodobacteraceae bacterium R_SAG10]|nr:hypothetical protein [Rhodobacteraceae bacterium R_SAG10]